MTNMTPTVGHNQLTAATIGNELSDLFTLRDKWEVGAYKTSNEGLYDILAKCLTLFKQAKGDRKLIPAINTRLTDLGIGYTKSTALATKIVRCVFGVSNQRTLTYARVITEADSRKTEKKSLSSWIKEMGGIEEVRRASAGQTPSQKKASFRKSAEGYFETAKPLIANFKPPVDKAKYFQRNQGEAHTFVALLARENDDGTCSIVYGASNALVVSDLLALAGKAEATEIEAWHARPAKIAKAKVIDQALTEEKAAKAA
ncbi:MAG: hypothetical protein CFE28_03870 [Alphaproteobacteria bacterium PA2]|nr:MAG: hypothetical protein CFE28_03870 [Alphaproteobacteria bacterium PA2]